MFLNILWKITKRWNILKINGKIFDNKLYVFEIYLNKQQIWLENYYSILKILKPNN